MATSGRIGRTRRSMWGSRGPSPDGQSKSNCWVNPRAGRRGGSFRAYCADKRGNPRDPQSQHNGGGASRSFGSNTGRQGPVDDRRTAWRALLNERFVRLRRRQVQRDLRGRVPALFPCFANGMPLRPAPLRTSAVAPLVARPIPPPIGGIDLSGLRKRR